jgi:predicted Zn-dependent protease
MLETIKQQLDAHPAVSAWKAIQVDSLSTQVYTTLGRREALRSVKSSSCQIELFTERMGRNGTPVQGNSSFDFTQVDASIPARIDAAVQRANLQENTPYQLPGPKNIYPEYNDTDPLIASDPGSIADQLTDRLNACQKQEPHISVSSSEFFLNHKQRRLINSNGLDVSTESSELLYDIVLLYKTADADTEFWEIYSSPGTAYFNLEEDFMRFARYAKDAAHTRIPKSGRCPVILTGDALHILFQYFANHSSASARYASSSLFLPGNPVINGSSKGDTLTLLSNALHPGGLKSYRFDNDGIPGQRTPIITNGVLEQYWATKQYADYLDIKPTGTFANFEILPGSVPWNDMLRSGERVILILQFSTFDPQPVSGDYLGEIRVGYEYRADGSVVPLRGGSVSGNVATGLEHCLFSKETATFANYFGPRGVRFESAQVAGE